jgi:hypothetical protein
MPFWIKAGGLICTNPQVLINSLYSSPISYLFSYRFLFFAKQIKDRTKQLVLPVVFVSKTHTFSNSKYTSYRGINPFPSRMGAPERRSIKPTTSGYRLGGHA